MLASIAAVTPNRRLVQWSGTIRHVRVSPLVGQRRLRFLSDFHSLRSFFSELSDFCRLLIEITLHVAVRNLAWLKGPIHHSRATNVRIVQSIDVIATDGGRQCNLLWVRREWAIFIFARHVARLLHWCACGQCRLLGRRRIRFLAECSTRGGPENSARSNPFDGLPVPPEFACTSRQRPVAGLEALPAGRRLSAYAINLRPAGFAASSSCSRRDHR